MRDAGIWPRHGGRKSVAMWLAVAILTAGITGCANVSDGSLAPGTVRVRAGGDFRFYSTVEGSN